MFIYDYTDVENTRTSQSKKSSSTGCAQFMWVRQAGTLV